MATHSKIVVIGAGSASFGLTNLGAILRTPELSGSELCLVDTNRNGLQAITRLAERVNRDWRAGFTIKSSVNREDCLQDADFVVLSIAIDREKCWRMDYEIAQKYRIMHYAENGGPGALFHTARNLAVVMPILRDMERMCPQAWLLNFTNPVPRICIAAARYTKIRAIGVCHQLSFGYFMLGTVLGKDLGIEVPDNMLFRWEPIFRGENAWARITREAEQKTDIVAAGLNHFTWMLSIRDKRTGEDLYPLFTKRLQSHSTDFEPLSRRMHAIFRLFPVPGDCHLCEYLPYTHNMDRDTWRKYDIQMYPFDLASAGRDSGWASIYEMAEGSKPIDSLLEAHTERAELVMAAMAANKHWYEPALNIPNQGYITNLPPEAIVEVPATVSGHGVNGIGVGSLPEPIAELCRREISVAELAVEAGVRGDRQLALQSLALDCMIDDPQAASCLLDEFLEAQAEYLPQFHPHKERH